MRKIISLLAIIIVCMAAMPGAGATASAARWTVNPADYRYDMSVYLRVGFGSSYMDYSRYEVAAFCGSECRGVAEVLELPGGGQPCLYLRIRSNQESGETINLKYYDTATGEEAIIDGNEIRFEANSRIGYPSSPLEVVVARYFDVDLSVQGNGTLNEESGRWPEGHELTLEATAGEGYSFKGWSDGNTDNPRKIVVSDNIALTAIFEVNVYKLTYVVDGEEYKTVDVAYGTAIEPEPAPVKEGHSFSGWEDLPETMPAHDVTVTGSFAINSYKAVFKIGDEVIATKEVVYGEPIPEVDAPEKEGHTFAGWQSVPETMPAHDIEIYGNYTVNIYKLTYILDGEEYKTFDVAYGTAIEPEPAPEKEGHSFSGWEGLPETMPAHDVTVTGSFAINSYKAVFKIGDEVIATKEVVYGEPIPEVDAPEKEGHTFAGWQSVPETMPAHDIEIYGSYTVNIYKLTYILDGEEYKTFDVAYGTAIEPEPAPEKEGHSFSGWEGLPETMPAHDVTVTGSFAINSYKAVFKIGDEVIATKEVLYGEPIPEVDAPEKEGHTFAGWQSVPETMPAHDIEIYGSYTVNIYKLTYVLDGEEYKTFDVAYGTAIEPEAAPVKEGHSFSGWEGLPETMPAHDIEIYGSYTVNIYKLTYVLDGEEYKTFDVAYGTAIEPEAAPEKEGHSFSGWEGLPETMPAHDVTVTGSFTVNSYLLTFYVDDVEIYSEMLEYGAEVVEPVVEVDPGRKFLGWEEEVPATMPAHDVEIHGYTTSVSAIDEIINNCDGPVDVYSISGYMLMHEVDAKAVIGKLSAGIYIIKTLDGKAVTICIR